MGEDFVGMKDAAKGRAGSQTTARVCLEKRC